MASDRVIAQMFQLLLAQWPKEPVKDLTLTVYARCLADLPDELLEAAVIHCLSTCTFMPRVAEIRKAATEIAAGALDIPTAYEAWGRVKQLIRHGYGHPNHQPAPDEFYGHPLVKRAVDCLGGLREIAFGENAEADRARFVAAYESLAERVRNQALYLPQVKQLADQMRMGFKGRRTLPAGQTVSELEGEKSRP